MQRILVCAADPVLAKKVRFLMERDECKVDILASADELGSSIQAEVPNLLVLSRKLGGGDALEWVHRFQGTIPVLVLGGKSNGATAPHVYVVPDPVDTTAIYREASRLLRSEQAARPSAPSPLEEVDEVLEALAEEPEPFSDAFDSESTLGVEAAFVQQFSAPKDAQNLNAAALAKAMHNLSVTRANRALVIESEGGRITVTFVGGHPVDVQRAGQGDTLGKSLVERGRIDRGQYAEAAIRTVESGSNLSEALLQMGLLAPSDLETELATNARERLVACFAQRRGKFWTTESTAKASNAFELDVGHILARGLRAHADEEAIDAIMAEHGSDYFKLRRPAFELQNELPLTQTDLNFLAFEGRAFNIEDASEGAGLPLSESRRLLALLYVCQEVDPFTPDAKAFEDRIREERETRKVLESQIPASAPSNPPAWNVPPAFETEASRPPSFIAREAKTDDEIALSLPSEDDPGEETTGPQPALPSRAAIMDADGHIAPSISQASSRAATVPPDPEPVHHRTPSSPPPLPSKPPPDPDVPPMPVPATGEGVSPRPLAFAKPLPRGPDGNLLDVPERTISREHFQNGVNLLGKGNFSTAEEHFRDAVALCAEEHVYLIGLARAIYYNPSYRPEGKIPILRSIVVRVRKLAPDDKRVAALDSWVSHAEMTYPAHS